MLRLCTTKAPFRCPSGQLYLQIDCIAMGSPLGVFAEAFMASVEETALADEATRPNLYCRYVDDILVEVDELVNIDTLKQRLEQESGLTFTIEHSIGDSINFLDVTIEADDQHYSTSVHRKLTDEGRRLFHQEVERIKQVLVNNDYDLTTIDRQIRTAIDKHLNPTETTEKNTINLFYKNQMTPGHKSDEAALKKIISRNCKPVEATSQLKLNIYYQSLTVSSLIMKNNLTKDET
ncbi:uncharacterized protein LOC122374653 [Amphibalanus amphitrite]|uniref:uncharacterized protein LOC122374652 n=1 Tax=Amphibalanus amphitrite TaxID=1232801 RepID=UPI001C924852|nr:uncharacterized protein LOC122374652 [Amphibalanus amphitrite]XP_043209462.1 uncharacterized protein LOC122374653 [Amphibalanus amphitrite]